MSSFIPTMSTIGWVETVEKKADYVLSCFITCNYSQTVLFAGKITSLQYVIKEFAGKELDLESKLRAVLDKLMTDAFQGDAVTTFVRVDVPDEDKPAQLSIRFNCTIVSNGVTYTVGKVVQTIDSRIVTINKIITG